jgi:hypothetical protein
MNGPRSLDGLRPLTYVVNERVRGLTRGTRALAGDVTFGGRPPARATLEGVRETARHANPNVLIPS